MNQFQLPQLVCVKANHLLPARFREWIHDSNHVYIGHNYERYTGLKLRGYPWTIPSLEFKKYNCDISIDEYMEEYRLYYKTQKMNDIMDLNGKIIGCFCEDFKTCHGSVIIALFKKELLERRCCGE